MLKFVFWLLVLANAALFAYHQGHLNWLFPDGRECVKRAAVCSLTRLPSPRQAAIRRRPGASNARKMPPV